VSSSDTFSQTDAGQQGFNRSLLSPFFLRSIILLSFYWAWMFLFHWTDVLVVGALDSRQPVLMMKSSGLAGALLALLVVLIIHWLRPGTRALANNRILPLLSMPAAPVAALLTVFGLPVSGAVLYACWFVSGVGSVFVLIRIGQILPKFNTEAATTLIFISLLLAALLDCVLLASPALVAALAMAIIPFVAIAVFWQADSVPDGSRQEGVATSQAALDQPAADQPTPGQPAPGPQPVPDQPAAPNQPVPPPPPPHHSPPAPQPVVSRR
jgi:hypothetical protein